MLKPSILFTDGAVLCRRKEIRVFGEVSGGAEVTVTLADRTGAVLAEAAAGGRDGRFLAALAPQEAATGCRLTITAGGETFTAEDISIGEVFLAGGQSNMELALRDAEEGPDLVRTHDDPQLRFFNVPRMPYAGAPECAAWEETRWHAVKPGEGGENSAAAYFFARVLREKAPEVPVGIIGCYWGGTSITCWMEEEALRETAEGARYLDEYAARTAGKTMEVFLREEATFERVFGEWCEKADAYRRAHPGTDWGAVEEACGPSPWCPPEGPGSAYRPGGLAVSMLARLVPATLTGILFYQGEEDAARTDCYDLLMIQLIRYWRKLFREADLPFVFVQLPMWLAYQGEDTFRWPLTRLAQAAARDAVRNAAMVCLLDQGEYGNIHPVAKRPVGERLAELAGVLLGRGGRVSPRAVGKYTTGSEMTVCLSAPVTVRGGGEPALLEIAGEDGAFVPARAEAAGDRLRLRAEGVDRPVRARYAWTDYSDRVNLFGENGLPLEPFDMR